MSLNINFCKAVEFDSSNIYALCVLGQLYSERNQTNQSISCFKQAIEKKPKAIQTRWAYLLLARYYLLPSKYPMYNAKLTVNNTNPTIEEQGWHYLKYAMIFPHVTPEFINSVANKNMDIMTQKKD